MYVRVDLQYDTVSVSLEEPDNCKQFHVVQAGEGGWPTDHDSGPSCVGSPQSRLLGETKGPEGVRVAVPIVVLGVKTQQARGGDDFPHAAKRSLNHGRLWQSHSVLFETALRVNR